MDLASNPTFSGVTFVNNGFNGLVLDAGPLVGDGVWDDAEVVYQLAGEVTIPIGETLTLGAGQVLKAGTFNDRLIVNGTLVADGTANQPIILT